MSDFARDDLSQLVDRVRGDLNSRLPGADSFLRRTFVNALAVAWAGLLFLLYAFLDSLAKELMPDTAVVWLSRHLSMWGIIVKSATFARRQVTLNGTVDAVVDADTVLQRQDGFQYKTVGSVTFTGATATASIIALVAGAAGNAAPGSSLSFVSPVSGVSSTCVVSADGRVDGVDVEGKEAARARMLERIRKPPQGGSQTDYEQWAKEVSGVTRAWVYPLAMGAGTVSVTFVIDGREDIIPTVDDVATVAAYIQARRPVTATVHVFAPIADVHDYSVSITPDTTAVRTAVEAELRDLYARDAEPGGTILRTRMDEALSVAKGELDHELFTPAGDMTAAAGHLPILGTISWV